MLRRDTLLRLLATIGRVLARTLGLRQEGRFDEALGEIRREGGQILGLDFKLLELVDEPSVTGFFMAGGMLDPGHLVIAGDLLRETGEILAGQGLPHEADDRRRRAVRCYLQALHDGVGLSNAELRERIAEVVASLADDGVPGDLEAQLAALAADA